MNKKQFCWLATSMLLAGQAAYGPRTARAGFDLSDTVDTKGSAPIGEGNFSRQKFTISTDLRFGYDDNPLAQPDTVTFRNVAGKIVTRGLSTNGSAFFNADLGLGYTAASPRAALSVNGDVGTTYYFDRSGRSYDVNGGLQLDLTYKAAPRLFVEGTSYSAYISQGDYGATNLTGFNGLAGGGASSGTTTGDINGDYFYNTETLAATYTASPRISLVTTYSIVDFFFEDSQYSEDENRVENYIQEEFRYLVQPQLTLTADYRFGYISYFHVPSDSYTSFILGGLNYVFNPRLRGQFQAGVEIRTYEDAPGDETSPYFQGSVVYDISRVAHLSLTAQYGIEEGDLTTLVSKSVTFRLGLTYDQNLTARVSVYGSFYFTHGYYSTPQDPNQPLLNFNEDTFDVSVGARYAVNRHFAAEIGYTHTTVDSQNDLRGYDRNRYFAGLRIQF